MIESRSSTLRTTKNQRAPYSHLPLVLLLLDFDLCCLLIRLGCRVTNIVWELSTFNVHYYRVFSIRNAVCGNDTHTPYMPNTLKVKMIIITLWNGNISLQCCGKVLRQWNVISIFIIWKSFLFSLPFYTRHDILINVCSNSKPVDKDLKNSKL